ncbi:MAG: carbohydrate ABC transporter permease [Candidatus Fimadaptatus sp.]|jgi:putative aldouronate transport system permease protein
MNASLSRSKGYFAFTVFNYILMGILALTCLLPIIHVLAVSFSDAASAGANKVTFFPMGFNTAAYDLVFRNAVFGRSFVISVVRTVVGTAISLLCTVLVAYPLSKDKSELKGRNIIRWIFVIPMLINGGVVPGFILIRNLHLINSIWALILPGCVPGMYIVMMMNFFRGINRGLLDSAAIDGADEITTLTRIILPLSTASIATIVLFTLVRYWNEWFGGLIFMSERSMWPLQTLLQQMMKTMDVTGFSSSDITMLTKLSDRSFRAAQIIIATVPIMCVYPFMQRFFITGITLGSVKE